MQGEVNASQVRLPTSPLAYAGMTGSKNEIAIHQRAEAVHLDLEVGLAVSVNIALDHKLAEGDQRRVQLAGLVVEGLCVDEMERLIT